MRHLWLHWVGSVRAQKRVFYRCSLRKCKISSTKWATAASPRPALQRGQHNNVAYWVSTVHWQGTKDLDHLEKNGIGTIKTAFWGLAGRFVAQTAKSGPFWVQKWCLFGPKINFLWPASKNVTIMTGHLKDKLCVEFAAIFHSTLLKKNQKGAHLSTSSWEPRR